jgi:hypothetical protein
MVPDILQNGDDFFFPVFTSDNEMGKYGENFSKMERPFTEALSLAVNNEKNVKGIVINAFTTPFVIPKEMFKIISEMPSCLHPDQN